MEETTVKLMYRYYASRHEDNTEQVMNVEQLFRHLSEKMANDDLYADLIDNDMRAALEDAQGKLDEGMEMVECILMGATIAQMCRTLSIGVLLSAMALIVFILPGMLATFKNNT